MEKKMGRPSRVASDRGRHARGGHGDRCDAAPGTGRRSPSRQWPHPRAPRWQWRCPGHDIGTDAQVAHGQEGDEHGQRQGQRDDEHRAQVHQKDMCARVTMRVSSSSARLSVSTARAMVRAVVEGHDADPLGQPGFEGRDLRFDG